MPAWTLPRPPGVRAAVSHLVAGEDRAGEAAAQPGHRAWGLLPPLADDWLPSPV